LADASRASIAELKAQWWQTETPNYLQWSADVGAIETTYTDDTTDNILQRAMGVKNAGVKYATDVGKSIKDYDVATAAAREEYISKLMTIAKSIGDTLLDAERDKCRPSCHRCVYQYNHQRRSISQEPRADCAIDDEYEVVGRIEE
jgi:hypothetical protein